MFELILMLPQPFSSFSSMYCKFSLVMFAFSLQELCFLLEQFQVSNYQSLFRFTSAHAWMCLHACMRVPVRTCVHVRACMCVCVCVCVCVCAHNG